MRQYRLPVRRAIRSKQVVTPDGVRAACVVFEEGRILGAENWIADCGSTPLLDAGDAYLLPGLVDSHVHINSPGRDEWEGFETATRAAAAGGYTCLVDMPLNSIPATTDLAALEQKRRAADGCCLVDYAFWGGAVPGNTGELGPLAKAGVAGFKSFLVHPGIEEFSMVGEEELRSAMPVIAETGLPLLVHAEDPLVIAKSSSEGNGRRYGTYLESRPETAEMAAVEMMIRLSRETRCRVHIVHVAAAAVLPLLRRARQHGVPITAETCPHYLHFASETIADGATQFKCAPPIRNAVNREALWSGLKDGILDLIATDHSPCPPAMKLPDEGDFLRAWGGIASLSVALPAVWTEASRRGFPISDVVRWMAQKPAELAGIGSRKGRIAPGYDADFVIFDPAVNVEVRTQDLHFRYPVSPYLGERLTGRVTMTFVRGTCVFNEGNFVASCPGRECTVGEWTTAS